MKQETNLLTRMSDAEFDDKQDAAESLCPSLGLDGCGEGEQVANRLRLAGLRPTRQRLALGMLLFGAGDRHVTAETLHAEAIASGEQVSLATVYNTLHQFTSAGLLRELAIEGGKAYFDTNTSNHNHFFIEDQGELMDIPGAEIRVDGVPEPPEGMVIRHIDVVVRLAPKG